MLTEPLLKLSLALFLLTGPAVAQTPMSAIDWLSDSLATVDDQNDVVPESDVAHSALPGDVSVSDIDGPSADAVGLLPVSQTGLPVNIWGQSRSTDLASRFRAVDAHMLPAMQDLLYTLLLAELDPPMDSQPDALLFLARLDGLLGLGALDQAQSLLDLSGQDQPQLFRRAFDVSLLLHTEDQACETLRTTPALSPTFPARVFCLARGGDWDAAALSLETGRALGYLTHTEDELLARFLDPLLFENEPAPDIATHPSPLVFRMMEAIGEPLSTSTLPRAFAHADLHSNTGWKAQIEAAERLVRSGALDPNHLLGLYSERRPAASGGVWDRVFAVQALEKAISTGDTQRINATLPIAWQQMTLAELEVPFAKLFFHQLAGLELGATQANLIFEIGLLSDQYEEVATGFEPTNDRQSLLISFARGQAGDVFSSNQIIAAMQDGFRADNVPVRLQSLTGNNRLGEAILRAMALFNDGAEGNLDELTDALAFFRAVGLEDVARRATLQLMLLERRG